MREKKDNIEEPRGERREGTGKYCGGKNETQNRNQRVGCGQQDILCMYY